MKKLRSILRKLHAKWLCLIGKDKEMKIIVPAVAHRRYYVCEDGKIGSERSFTTNVFTLKRAIDYLSSHVYDFENTIIHNVDLRNAMREVGATALVSHLQSIRPVSEELKKRMVLFVEKWNNVPLGDYDIQILPTTATLDFGFGPIAGLEAIKKSVEASMQTTYFDDVDVLRRENHSSLHAGEVWAAYPRFDSSDECDDRTYQNYIIRDHEISDDEMKQFARVKCRINHCRVHEVIPQDLLPMIYYDGERGFMLVATKPNQLRWEL